MKPLEEMTIGQRFLLMIVIVLVILFALAFCGYDRWEAVGAPEPFEPITKWEKHILALEREAIDNAYRDQVEHLFQIWMKDEAGQPHRAVVGVRAARRAYVAIQQRFEQRERQLGEQNR